MVFATETLAAGVNMPARATVITTLSKRIDTGIVKLKPSELLQMGGRWVLGDDCPRFGMKCYGMTTIRYKVLWNDNDSVFMLRNDNDLV